jgi:hypothetical protein
VRARRGRKKPVVVITHSANATVNHLPIAFSLSIVRLPPGPHALTIRLAYQRHTSLHRRHDQSITKTLRARFAVC